MISHIDHIVITVVDVEKSVAFYSQVLDMEPITFANGRRALKFGNQKINLQTLGQEERNRAGVGSADFCLISKIPVNEVIKRLASFNVKILEGPVTKSGAMGSMTSVYFNDPDKNLVEVSFYE